MGFLKRSMEDREPEDEDKDPAALEERYQRLFMKMGRDFVHVDDFVSVIESILEIIDPDNDHRVDPSENAGVMTMAVRYKELIDDGNSSEMKIFDLIDLSEN